MLICANYLHINILVIRASTHMETLIIVFSCVNENYYFFIKKFEKTYRIDLLKSRSMLQHKISKSSHRVFSFSY